MDDPEQTGLALLRASGLVIPENEAARLAASYAPVRARADALYEVGGYGPVPILRFDASFAPAATEEV